jgi:hypothetical protein
MMFFETLWIKAQAKITDGILALGEQVMDFIGKIPGAEKLLGKGGMTSADFAKAREFAREDYQRRITGVQDETGQSISAYRKTQQDANAGREFEIDNERKALDAKLAAIEERRLLAQTDQYAADFASAMGAGLAVPGGAISPASLPGMPGGAGAAGAGMVDSGIRVTANEAIERGSMAAAKLDSEQYVRDLAGEQLSALEQIVRNTDPANQVGDEGEGV